MSLKQSLKAAWNRIQCEMDIAGVNMFISKELNDELAKEGWKVKFHHMLMGPSSRPAAISFQEVTNPRGEQVYTQEQFKEYRAARREAAYRVYGLK